MGEYSDVKRKRMYRLLKWLADQKGVTVEPGGEHQYNIKCTSWSRPYPIPFKHGIVIKYFVYFLKIRYNVSDEIFSLKKTYFCQQ